MITAQAIKSRHPDVFTFMHGDLDSLASHCDPPEDSSSLSLVFVGNAQQLKQAYLHEPAIVVLQSKLADSLVFDANVKSCYFSVKSVPMGMATLLQYFDQKTSRFTQWGSRHPTSLVHVRARVGKDVVLGPFCVIGANATIADGCMIGAHSIIENDAKIGVRTVIHPQVFVGAQCVIGSDCEIHPNTTIGSDGFGYAVDKDGRPQKISHLGNVVIGDCVEIRSGCAVDRATLTSTRIRSGTKIDNLCHIAHNCDLGENGFYTAGFMMGGSTTIGRQFVTGGGSVVTAHVTLGDNVVLAGRSTVTHDVPRAGAYGGYPLQSLSEALKTVVSMGQLNEIRKNLNRVLKQLNLEEVTHDTPNSAAPVKK